MIDPVNLERELKMERIINGNVICFLKILLKCSRTNNFNEKYRLAT